MAWHACVQVCIWASLLSAGLLRLWVARAPSVKKYIAYRFLLSILLPPFFPAMRAAIGDMVGRSSEEYTHLSNRMETVATAVRIVSLYAVGRLAKPRVGMFVAACCSLSAAAVSFFGLKETLQTKDRRPMDWKGLRNPMTSLTVFETSPAFKRLAALHVLMSIPANNG